MLFVSVACFFVFVYFHQTSNYVVMVPYALVRLLILMETNLHTDTKLLYQEQQARRNRVVRLLFIERDLNLIVHMPAPENLLKTICLSQDGLSVTAKNTLNMHCPYREACSRVIRATRLWWR